ncbi:unnamed protein product [Prorocentrum cordatum]|uniref:Uncharacterized protein n=1 Tax=Prorocentrum cordatum TaxID=2364126 RepID=A0ABN9UJ09_9DINO|nr:unnamed protein product [Polarella glacialis]
MPAASARRSGLVPASLVAAATLASVSRTFVAPRTPAARSGRTAARGFKEDFEAWRGSLTPEESTMLKKQAAGEFNKKFRKSDEFKKDLPDEKVQSFSKILGKFFEAEADDYKKEPGSEAPDPDGLLFKGTESKMDFRLKSRIVEIDRDAERRYHFAALRTTHAAYRGEFWPSSSPMKDVYYFQNNDTDSHDMLVKAVENAGVPVEVPPIGEKFSLVLPRCLFQDINEVGSNLMAWKEQFGVSDDDYKEAVEKEKSGKKMPPLDEEFLADLEQIPAVDEVSFRHPWGIADKLYKSEAIDAFGFKYLLGVFETVPEAEAAFDSWNAEFDQARADMENELGQWSKQEQARLDADTAGQEAMKVVMEQGRVRAAGRLGDTYTGRLGALKVEGPLDGKASGCIRENCWSRGRCGTWLPLGGTARELDHDAKLLLLAEHTLSLRGRPAGASCLEGLSLTPEVAFPAQEGNRRPPRQRRGRWQCPTSRAPRAFRWTSTPSSCWARPPRARLPTGRGKGRRRTDAATFRTRPRRPRRSCWRPSRATSCYP